MTQAAEIVRSYMVETTQDLVRSYTEKGLKASGKYEKGLTYTVEDDGKKIHAVIESEGHVWFMEKGRRPNKQQTAKQARSLGKILEQWVRDKGIDVNPYAAAWKIVREGIDVPNRNNPGKVVENQGHLRMVGPAGLFQKTQCFPEGGLRQLQVVGGVTGGSQAGQGPGDQRMPLLVHLLADCE